VVKRTGGVEAENPRALDVAYRTTDRLETLEILIGHPIEIPHRFMTQVHAVWRGRM
jgi:hypothetical protein